MCCSCDEQVQAYLESFADYYDLHPMLNYNSAITAISPIMQHNNTQPHPTSSHAPNHHDSSTSSSRSSAASTATAASEASSHSGNSLDQDPRPELSSSPEPEVSERMVCLLQSAHKVSSAGGAHGQVVGLLVGGLRESADLSHINSKQSGQVRRGSELQERLKLHTPVLLPNSK